MSGKSDPATVKGGACPICKRLAVAAYQPFCSRRCADVDLHRWLSDGYAVPAVEADEEPGDGGDSDKE